MIAGFNDLINNYQYVGDLGVVILCLVLILCIKKSYVIVSKISKIFVIAIMLICFSSIANMIAYISGVHGNISTIVFTFILCVVNIVYSLIFYFYILYITDLAKLDRKKNKFYIIAIVLINCSRILYCLITRLFEIRSKTNIYDMSVYFGFLLFSYLISFIIILRVIYLSNNIIKPVKYVLSVAVFTSLYLVFTSLPNGNISFINISFSIPIIVVMVMLHSSPYDISTGALSGSAFKDFIVELDSFKDMSLICIKFYNIKDRIISDELSNILKSAYSFKINDIKLYNENYRVFVITIDKEKNDINNIEKEILNLCNNLAYKFTDINIDFKLLVINSNMLDIKTGVDFDKLLEYLFNKYKINTVNVCGFDVYENIKRASLITEKVLRIANESNLNDYHVLVYCQPIKDVKTNSYTTAEALMRLDLDELGMIQPYEFVPILEDLGLIHIFSMIMLNKICRYLKYDCSNENIKRISVNFSVDELRDKEFIEDFKHIIGLNKIPYSRIGIEFTESTNDVAFLEVKRVVENLKDLGCTVYLDDFGTGYSNFDRLIGLGMNVIKFDRSLLVLAETEEKISYFINSFSEVFIKMGFEVLYEGIETDSQEQLCITSNANYLQGYKYSKPIPIEDLDRFIKRSKM